MQHLGLSRLSSPLNSLHSLAALLRCQLLLHNLSSVPQSFAHHPLISLLLIIHVRKVRIPQISVLLEVLHPLLQEGTAPEECVSNVRMGEGCRCCDQAETAARGRVDVACRYGMGLVRVHTCTSASHSPSSPPLCFKSILPAHHIATRFDRR